MIVEAMKVMWISWRHAEDGKWQVRTYSIPEHPTGVVVAVCDAKEIADHIVNLHNKTLTPSGHTNW